MLPKISKKLLMNEEELINEKIYIDPLKFFANKGNY